MFRVFPGGSLAQQPKGNQEDPCKLKSRVVGDEVYCDRYWECVNGQPELYDCPNGLVFAGKNRGVTEGCDYPWRSNYCDNKQQASEYNLSQSKTVRSRLFEFILIHYTTLYSKTQPCTKNRHRSIR